MAHGDFTGIHAHFLLLGSKVHHTANSSDRHPHIKIGLAQCVFPCISRVSFPIKRGTTILQHTHPSHVLLLNKAPSDLEVVARGSKGPA